MRQRVGLRVSPWVARCACCSAACSPLSRAPIRMLFLTGPICTSLESNKSISVGASLRRPACDSGLWYFSADRYFPLFARSRRLARANSTKSRRMQTATESLRGISVAMSQTVGLNSESQRPVGRRLYLPGWGAGIRTPEWRYQKPLPYHLATPQCRERRRVMQFARRKQLPGIDGFAANSRATAGRKGLPFPPHRMALRPKRKAAIAPPPSEYSSAW